MTDRRPSICEKRGCYIQPKSLFPEWDKLNERCKLCPYPVDHDVDCDAFGTKQGGGKP